MKKKTISRKLSWVLTVGLAMANPMYPYAKEPNLLKNGQTEKADKDRTAETGKSTQMTEGQFPPQQETQIPEETETQRMDQTESEEETALTDPAVQEPQTEAESEEKRKRKKEETETERKPETEELTEDIQETEEVQETDTEQSEEGSETPASGGAVNDQIRYAPEPIKEDFRFVRVEGELAAADTDLYIFEEMKEESRSVGTLPEGGICYVLKSVDDWLYVESGLVRGFVKAKDILFGENAGKKIRQRASYLSESLPVDELKGETEFVSYSVSVEDLGEQAQEIEWELCYASPLIDPADNQAIAYTKTTTREVVSEKVWGIAARETVPVLGSMDRKSQLQTGILKEGSLCFILEDTGEGWYYVESGDVRGFVEKDRLLTGEEAQRLVESKGEQELSLAEKSIEPEDNPALYYTLASVKEGGVASAIRTAMVKFAVSFTGNPYVWGGTSLTQGADCSGFVQSVYAQYGYLLPRVAADQAQYGTKISVSEALPGDLIFYEKDGEIYHVVMYIGDGRVAEAANEKSGIITSQVRTDQAVWAVRIISDEDEEVIRAVNGSANAGQTADQEDYGVYLGKFKLTSYCSCALCCGQWANGVTASGTAPTEGRTVAMAGVPFGTRLVIRDQIYVVEDRGTPYGHVDIYKNDHESSKIFGVQYADVYAAN